ncbi:MAG: YcaO-like family protein [Bdellovibrionota bacterium]
MLLLKQNVARSKAVGDWTLEPEFTDKVTLENLSIYLSGIEATHPKFGPVTGSAAELGTYPSDRAWYELIERITLVENFTSDQNSYPLLNADGSKTGRILGKEWVFPIAHSPEYQFSKSNGAALHRTWAEACKRAAFELVERHLILSSWVGLIRPLVTMEGAARSPLNSIRQLYEVKRVHFGAQKVTNMATPVFVSGVALLPRNETAPLILGFGAGESSRDSLRKAEEETFQRLGFLWGEEIPSELPEFSPTNLYHQDYYLMPQQRDKIEGWLSGAFYKSPTQDIEPENTLSRTLDIHFVDLSLFAELELKVARAFCPEAIPLVFGKWRGREFSDLPDSLLLHPIA